MSQRIKELEKLREEQGRSRGYKECYNMVKDFLTRTSNERY